MKYIISLYSLISICLIMASCTERYRLKVMMKDFMKTEIVIPDDLECIYHREINTINLDSIKESVFIIYYDSLDCSSCRIGRLTDNYPLYEMADSIGFSLMTIFSPPIDELDEVRLHLMLSSHSIPIYLDTNGTFRRLNHTIPTDLRFHKFFVAPDSHPAFVGDPLASHKLSELFEKVLIQTNIINY